MKCTKCNGIGILAYDPLMDCVCYICHGTGKIEEEDCIEKAKRWDEIHGK